MATLDRRLRQAKELRACQMLRLGTIVSTSLTVLVMAAAGCRSASTRPPRSVTDLHGETAALTAALSTLGPQVDRSEAARAARVIVATVEAQRQATGLHGRPRRRNLAVNLGLADWGLCWQWAELVGRRLHKENLRTLGVHWACAHAGSSLREHNAVVITAREQPFDHGLVIDPWRRGGRLTWVRVPNDRYPWQHEPWSETRWGWHSPDPFQER